MAPGNHDVVALAPGLTTANTYDGIYLGYVLVYTTAAPLEVTGPVRLMLHASSDAPDTDFTGKLVEVRAAMQVGAKGAVHFMFVMSFRNPG